MLGRCSGAVLEGIEGRLIEVEVDLGGGLPVIATVGLPDLAIREGIDRIRSALRHAGFRLPRHRVTINLAPAEVRKQGSSLDLPMAVALLSADGQLGPEPIDPRTVFSGELGLDGSVRPIRGTLSVALAAREAGRVRIVVPERNAQEAALVEDLDVVPVRTLAEIAALARGERRPRPQVALDALLRGASIARSDHDLAQVRGQVVARRALEIAATGSHHLLLCGPPGAGKTMLARTLPGLLPPLGAAEALEVTRVFSAVDPVCGLVTRRPFRAPHPTVSYAGMTGGGIRLRPGEISLATHGVLYLDELPEFRRDALEALRQPLEEGRMTVVRARGAATFPATFTLVASMNPCPCGYHGTADERCACTDPEIRRYRGRLSGPLLDRFDLVVDVPAVDPAALAGSPDGESSAAVRTRVEHGRRRQAQRLVDSRASCNGRMGPRELARHAALPGDAQRLLVRAAERLGLSARGFDRVRRVARTIADLDGSEGIGENHVAEALQYRPLARGSESGRFR